MLLLFGISFRFHQPTYTSTYEAMSGQLNRGRRPVTRAGIERLFTLGTPDVYSIHSYIYSEDRYRRKYLVPDLLLRLPNQTQILVDIIKESEDPRCKAEAFICLGNIANNPSRGDKAREVLLDLSKSGSKEQKRNAVIALGHAYGEEIISSLIGCLSETNIDQDIKVEAVRSLGHNMHNYSHLIIPAMITLLKENLESEDIIRTVTDVISSKKASLSIEELFRLKGTIGEILKNDLSTEIQRHLESARSSVEKELIYIERHPPRNGGWGPTKSRRDWENYFGRKGRLNPVS